MTTSTIEELTAEEREWLTGNPNRFTQHTAIILAKLFRIYEAQVEALKIAESVRAYAESCSKFHVDSKDDDDYRLMSNPVTRAEEQKRNQELTDELAMMKYYGRVTLGRCQEDLKSLQDRVDRALECFSHVD